MRNVSPRPPNHLILLNLPFFIIFAEDRMLLHSSRYRITSSLYVECFSPASQSSKQSHLLAFSTLFWFVSIIFWVLRLWTNEKKMFYSISVNHIEYIVLVRSWICHCFRLYRLDIKWRQIIKDTTATIPFSWYSTFVLSSEHEQPEASAQNNY